jgi:hypothetical protein
VLVDSRREMAIVQSVKPVQSRFEQRLEVLDAFCRYLRPRLRGRLKVERTDDGTPPPTWSVIAENEAPIVSFGVIETIFFWTFDAGVSNHYSRDNELMTRTIAGELARSGHLSHAP